MIAHFGIGLMGAGFVRTALEEGARHGVRYDVLPGIAAFFDRAIAAGHGWEDVGAVAALR